MDLNKALMAMKKNGLCPALIFDDNGKWALSCYSVSEFGEERPWVNIDLDGVDWRDTPEEAVKAFMHREGM